MIPANIISMLQKAQMGQAGPLRQPIPGQGPDAYNPLDDSTSADQTSGDATQSVNPETGAVDTADSTSMGATEKPDVDYNEEVPNSGQNDAGEKSETAGSGTKNILQSPEFQALMQKYGDLSQQAISQQQEGIGSLQDVAKKYAALNPQMDLSGLAGLADQFNNGTTHYQEKYSKPLTPEQYLTGLATVQEALQKSKQGLTQEQLNLLKDQIEPYSKMSQSGMLQQARQEQAERNAANRGLQNLSQRLANNKSLSSNLNVFQVLDNSLTNMAAGKIRTPQQLQDFQKSIIQGLGMKSGQSGVNERAEQYFNTASLDGSRLMQFLTSQPQDVLKDKELIGHLQDLARQEQVNVHSQYNKALDAVTAGLSRFTDKYPDIKRDFDSMISAYQNQFITPQKPDITTLQKGQKVQVGPKPPDFAPTPKPSLDEAISDAQNIIKTSQDPDRVKKAQDFLSKHGNQ